MVRSLKLVLLTCFDLLYRVLVIFPYIGFGFSAQIIPTIVLVRDPRFEPVLI